MTSQRPEDSQKIPQNTFLSRIFGLQSDEVSSTITSGGLIAYNTKATDSSDSALEGIGKRKKVLNELGNDEEGLRIPESDQESSTEDGNSSSENDFRINNQLNPAIHDLENNNNNNNNNNYGFNNKKDSIINDSFINNKPTGGKRNDILFKSLPKLGQVSSDEEEFSANEDENQINNDLINKKNKFSRTISPRKNQNFQPNLTDIQSMYEEDEEDDEMNEDATLLGHNKYNKHYNEDENFIKQSSLLIPRSIKNTFSKPPIDRRKQLFTSSNEANKSNYLNNNIQDNFIDLEGNRNSNIDRKNIRVSTIFGNNNPNTNFIQDSFLNIRGNTRTSTNNRNPRSSQQPGLFKNIQVLNNTPKNRLDTISPKETALWKWANVENLDIFFRDVYKYYLGNGFYCIVLQKYLNIATLLFVVFISTFMAYCIDYSLIPTSSKLSDVRIDKCYSSNISGFTKLFMYIFYVFITLKCIQLYFDIKNLREIQKFYRYLLNISDKELETISWQRIVEQLILLKDQNALTANVVEVKAKNRIDAHDVANRIMRKDNYFIALINSEILNLTLPLPFYSNSILTKTLEWNLNLCIFGFVFNEGGYLKQNILKESHRERLVEELQKRFLLAGFLNIILAPFLVCYFVLLYFFRYFNEFKTSPGNLGARQYSPLAEWKFREYNELYHLFQKRLGLSRELADKYIQQFPNESTNILLKFVTLISGSFVAILVLLTIFDPENFFNFEISKDKTALFYITLFGSIWTICHNLIPNEYRVFDPEETLKELATYTHFLPNTWKGRYHMEEVKQEFCELYNLRVIVLLRELASLILTPFILWFSLPRNACDIIDFFRNNSTYVDGLGYVCKYAMFEVDEKPIIQTNSKDFKTAHDEGHNMNSWTVSDEDDASDLEDNEDRNARERMMRSYMYFIDDYENKDNMVGKTQIPPMKTENKPVNWTTDYSWKKQFKPGQRPDLFLINQQLNDRPSNNNVREYNSTAPKNWQKNFNSDRGTVDLGESFINSGILKRPDRLQKPIQKTGVLALVKEYYKDTEIGR